MSVAQLTARELGLFAAIAHKHAGQPLPSMLELAGRISDGNCGAWSGTYQDRIEPADDDEIERWALDYLAGRREMVDDHFGPLVYNMVANDGKAYVAPGVEATGGQGAAVLAAIRAVEEKCKTWQQAAAREKRRAEEDAASFDDIGQLPKLTAAEVAERMKAAGANRVIVAEFRVDQSDSQSDYCGGRTARRVVIGYGTGKRESFRQLRKAAGAFPPTADMGPGQDIWKPRVVLLEDVKDGGGGGYYKGSYSHWHRELEDGAHCRTRAEAEAWIADKGEPESIGFDGQTVRFGWRIDCESYEHRENYSMGGGNYLGSSRYGGWQVRSQEGIGENGLVEFFQPSKTDLERLKNMENAAKTAAQPRQAKPKGPFWTKKGLLSEQEDGNWPQCFRKRATVEAKQAELRAAGVETEIRCGFRRNHFYLMQVEAPPAVEMPPEPPPEVVSSPEVEAMAWL